jgi:ABC-type metal ion transport system, periplasmic component/surface adhesin
MKNKILILIGLILVFTTGCFKRDIMEDINIATTIYPIEYVTERLYGDSSNIKTIYPRGVYSPEYKLTKKQLKDFSKYDLFIYNGNSDEKEYATYMLNKNNNLKIIDAAYSLEEVYHRSDIWLNPSNILMIAQNIRNELSDYITNKYIKAEIEQKYQDFKVDITKLETEMKIAADNSSDKRIICADESLRFLEKYGFEVISLMEDGKLNENNLELAIDLLDDEKLSTIFVTIESKDNDGVKKVKEYMGDVKTTEISLLENINEEDVKNNMDYISIMYNNLDLIKQETYQ